MSFPYPRRVKDLTPPEPESEDEFNTPQKPLSGGNNKQQNKENEVANSCRSNNHVGSSFTNMRMYPKRSSELPPLESDDSEEEDNVKDDNLNCAILNDSFIMSPTKSEPDESESASAAPKVNDENACAETAKTKASVSSGNLSFILRFDKMALDSGETNEAPKQTPVASKACFTTSNNTLPSIQEHPKTNNALAGRRVNVNADDVAKRQTEAKHKELFTPFKNESAASNSGSTVVANTSTTSSTTATTSSTTTSNTATTAATVEAQFATPQIRSFSVQRRPRDLCSTQSQKTRSAIDNEFRSQKVLFQTPMAMTRAPPSIRLQPNDSIFDTINESSVATPSTTEKGDNGMDQNAPAGVDAVGKSKKSLEGAFLDADKKDEGAKENAALKEAAKPTTSAASAKALTTASKSDKPTILRICNADYAILKKLGCGGSSSVYLARREDNAQEYALKVVDLCGDPVVLEGYLNETKLLAKLQGNVCVVALFQYELFRKESKLYLVMEKGDSDLHKILQTYSTNLPLYVLTNFLYQMLQAVNYIHNNGVIHSDLKPANFLMINGRLKLIDFGIASNIAIDSTSIIKFSQAGTFNYISPEALTDTSTGSSPMRSHQPKIKISTKSDVWSLGCILYLLLYKKTPFSHIKNIYAKVSAISSPTHVIEYPALPPYYPAVLIHMARNCLQHNPKKRPSCAELLTYPFNMLIPIQNLAVPPPN